jgi:hypothetical protein
VPVHQLPYALDRVPDVEQLADQRWPGRYVRAVNWRQYALVACDPTGSG